MHQLGDQNSQVNYSSVCYVLHMTIVMYASLQRTIVFVESRVGKSPLPVPP